MKDPMKMRKNIITTLSYYMTFTATAVICLTAPALAGNQDPGKVDFLQAIQNKLSQASGAKAIAIHVVAGKKRRINLSPSSITLSYGFLKDIKNINQMVATLAHLTAYINLGYAVTPPKKSRQEKGQKTSLGKYLKSTIRPEYPDQGYMPEAKGTFQENRDEPITRPSYKNQAYDFSVNRTNILATEHELDVDKATDKIMQRAGYCPQDYSRLLHYFYENPQKFPENKHFTLDADQWQRIDAADRRADPADPCNKDQLVLTKKYAGDFRQMKSKILLALKNSPKNTLKNTPKSDPKSEKPG